MTNHNFAYSIRIAGLCAIASMMSAPLLAAPINYGDMDDFAGGGVVEYQDITESSPSGDSPPLYNVPEVTVNQLDFDPTGFGASATNGDLDITDGQLNFSFETLLGTGLRSLLIEEGGDYRFFGAGTIATQASFSLFADVTVTAVDGVTLAPTGPSGQFSINGNNGASLNAVDNPTPTANLPWNFGLVLDFGPALAARGFGADAVVTGAEVVIDNTLYVGSEVGSAAFLAKKNITISPRGPLDPDNVIPEPTAAVLALLATAGFVARRR